MEILNPQQSSIKILNRIIIPSTVEPDTQISQATFRLCKLCGTRFNHLKDLD